MKEIFTQIRNSCPVCRQETGTYLLPSDADSVEALKDYKMFQIVRNKIVGIRKQRSVKQLNLYWAACKYVADNTDNIQWNTKDKVDFHCRVAAHFVDPNIVAVKPDGTVQFMYRSIAFKNLKHIEACRYFEQAFDIMAKFLKMTAEDLIQATKEQMLS